MIAQIEERLGRLRQQATDAMDEINRNTDESRSAELAQRHDTIMDEYDAVMDEFRRAQRHTQIERDQAEAEERARSQRPLTDGDGDRDEPGEGGASYRDAFHAALRVGGDVSQLNSEQRSLLAGNQASAEVRQQLTTSGAAGGFLVPTELSDQIIVAMEATGPMYDSDIVTVIETTGGGQIPVPSVDDTGDSSTVEHTEGADPADDDSGDIVIGQQVLDAYVRNTPFVKWSMEAGADSIVSIEALLTRLLGRRLSKIANSDLTIGDGVNRPHGVMNAGVGHTAALAGAFTFEELIELEHSVDPTYRANASFMMNDQSKKVMRKVKDADGNFIWQPADIRTGAPQSLLGYALHINQACAAIGANAKPVAFGDFKEYYVRRVGSPIIGIMRERFWPNLGIAGLIRFDGEFGDTRAIKTLRMAAA